MTIEQFNKLSVMDQQKLLVASVSLLTKSEHERDRLLLHLSSDECERCMAIFIEYFETFLERSEVVHLDINKAQSAMMN